VATHTSTIAFEEQYNELVRQYRLRDRVAYNSPKQKLEPTDVIAVISQPEPEPAPTPEPAALGIPETIKAYPRLLNAFYTANLAPVGRVYKICRAFDQAGRGWLGLAELRSLVTDKRSPWHICGKRNLRGILRKGNGLAWHLADDRIYYRSPAKIMTSLGAGRLIGSPVLLPVKAALLSGIAAFKAHVPAAWHAGRRESNPISRESIRTAVGVPESTQRRYDKIAGVKSGKDNYVVGGEKTKESYQDAMYQHGHGVLTFTDHIGKMGAPGKEYLSWRIPNTFETPLQQTVKGRQKKINRAIDLVIYPERGNGNEIDRLYHQDGGSAAGAFNRNPNHNHYWPLVTTLKRTAYKKPKLQGVGLWSVFEGQT